MLAQHRAVGAHHCLLATDCCCISIECVFAQRLDEIETVLECARWSCSS